MNRRSRNIAFAVLLAAIPLVPVAAYLAGLHFIAQSPHTHGVLDSQSILISLLVGVLALVRYHLAGERSVLLVGAAFLAHGLLQVAHTVFHHELLLAHHWNNDLEFYLGLAARAALAALLLAASLAFGRTAPQKIRGRLVLVAATVPALTLTAAALLALGQAALPGTAPPEGWAQTGVFGHYADFTPFSSPQVLGELASAALLAAALALFVRRHWKTGQGLYGWLAIASVPLAYAMIYHGLFPRTYEALWYYGHVLQVAGEIILGTWFVTALIRSQMREQSDRLGAILDQLPEGVVVLDARQKRVVLANRVSDTLLGCSVTGLDYAEVASIVPFLTVDGRIMPAERRPLARALVGEHYQGEEVLVRRPGGAEVSLFISAAPIYDQGDRLTHALAVFQDISAQHLVRVELGRRASQLETLMREAHHRIRNNLQSVIALLELERDHVGPASQPSLDRCAARIRAIATVHRLLTTQPANTVSLQNLLKGLAELARSAPAEHGPDHIDIGVSGPSFDVPSKTATNLAIVVNELISNAMTHAFAGRQRGRIAITVGSADGGLEIAVTDDGGGCPADAPAGTGLVLVRSIVEHDLQGRFEMRSSDEGCQCLVRFQLEGAAT